MLTAFTNTKHGSVITVEAAEEIILAQKIDYGLETIPLQESLGKVLAEDLKADRNLPPFNRVAMDGIAINYKAIENGVRNFKIKATQAAGETPIEINSLNECIEIMTGCALPASTDTIVRYEDLDIKETEAYLLTENVTKGQNIHREGADKKKGGPIVEKNQVITPAIVGAAASVGASDMPVKKVPRIVIISTGNELVDIGTTPSPYQLRRSNSYSIEAALKFHGIPVNTIHVADDLLIMKKEIKSCLDEHEVLILTGGISMGKFDYVSQALEELSVKKLFHKVLQRPGKPFWFGRHQNKLVFALPGNPVSCFLCLHRYVLPWIKTCLGLIHSNYYAVLNKAVEFQPSLTYFIQVKLKACEEGKLLAEPLTNNGSGDFSSLVEADAFMELPADRSFFEKGEVFRVWPLKIN
jgi:molybdopterin molybdotransferase